MACRASGLTKSKSIQVSLTIPGRGGSNPNAGLFVWRGRKRAHSRLPDGPRSADVFGAGLSYFLGSGPGSLALGTKNARISLLLMEIPLYTAPSHTETWLKRPSGGSRADKARLLTRFRRNQPEN